MTPAERALLIQSFALRDAAAVLAMNPRLDPDLGADLHLTLERFDVLALKAGFDPSERASIGEVGRPPRKDRP